MTTEIIYRETRRRYQWPEVQLNLWIFIVLVAASTCLGIFAWFMTVQTQMRLGIPWLFPYGVTVSSLALVFLLIILILAGQRLLIPGIILLGSFILFVLWLTLLIETSIQLYGPAANVNGNCETYVQRQAFTGVSVETLQYLTQLNICNCWRAAFAFEVVGTVFFLYMMVLAWQVQRDDYD
ncbi:hypothetical protein GJ744_006911 [Endocarpon pusillum]|uniref:MARVEL domain-containing protein n=1 Tax=Endocarpon pusillum TaxID=364733 RepID=A0A8H7AS90_9EURO|nr:hypothetical protein GJ744_006911 [Endocarpon pusillum]